MAYGIIAALATPPGVSALAVIRASGEGCARMAEEYFGLAEGRLLGMRRALSACPGSSSRGEAEVIQTGDAARGPAAGSSSRGGAEVLLLSWPAGRSFTGEEMVEIMCPGSMMIAGEILNGLEALGARPSGPGEFTRRAFLSGRMSAIEVIALSSIWRSGAGAVVSRELEEAAAALEKALGRVQESIEAAIEFSEEHNIEEEGNEALFEAAGSSAGELASAAGRAEGPVRVFLAGPVNSGKSTLFNTLAGRERAVVTPEEGTTRDGASALLVAAGREVELFDTPGFRQGGEGDADRRALEIAIGMVGRDDIVVWMSRGGSEKPDYEMADRAGITIEVSSLADECGGAGLRLSSRTGEGVEALKALIAASRPPGMLSCLAAGIGLHIEAARRMCAAGEMAGASEEVAEALEELASVMDRGSGIELAVERALGRLCVGK